MPRSELDTAKYLMRRRKFKFALDFLESNEDRYEGDFEYYVTLGIAYLYADIMGNAVSCFKRAREIKLMDSRLLLGQAVIFLRRGETERALQYYLDVLDLDGKNETAKAALEFIRKQGDYPAICRMVDTGEIEKFYPPLGFNPDIVRNGILIGFLAGIVISLGIVFGPGFFASHETPDDFDARFTLTARELSAPVTNELSGQTVSDILTAKEVTQSFSDAKKYFSKGRDNLCRVELNRIMKSNAAISIKEKAAEMESLLETPTFGTLKDSFAYADVLKDPSLFMGCCVSWSGRISDVRKLPDGKWSCSLLIGYETGKNVEGIVTVVFDSEPRPEVVESKPVRFLGSIDCENGAVFLHGISVYQPLKGNRL